LRLAARRQGNVDASSEGAKVVSALFCDLVGFTATSEGADPEDVDRMLTAYFAMARSQIEAHGGVVEKFISDAVLGVFGVPAARGRSRARGGPPSGSLRRPNLRGLAGAPLRLRVGINTGEALVRLAVVPGRASGLAGDAINTASRIQSTAPEMGVAVGQATYEATKGSSSTELPAARLKGKAEPVRVFHARSPSRLGLDLTRTDRGPYVGREIDLTSSGPL
jgi:class 3 adenylate cyclase